MSTQSFVDSASLYYQLCLAADEYTSFRNMMMATPGGDSPAANQAAVQRADGVAALLRQLRDRQVVSFLDGLSIQPDTAPQIPAPQPPLQDVTPPALPQGQPVGPQYAWACSACNGQFTTSTALPPNKCPCCSTELST